jgi:hypothetical protein
LSHLEKISRVVFIAKKKSRERRVKEKKPTRKVKERKGRKSKEMERKKAEKGRSKCWKDEMRKIKVSYSRKYSINALWKRTK